MMERHNGMEKLPKFSIIVPCYNQAQYLDECLESVRTQTCQDWECIIVNDGSPDNTNAVARKWCDKDTRFCYYEKPNEGLAATRNYGIERALGKYILPLDADDKIGAQYLELALKKFADNADLKVIYCKAVFFGTRTGSWELNPYSYRQLLISNTMFCSAIFLKDDWKKTGGYDISMKEGYEDWEFWINLLKEGGGVCQIESVQFYYRVKTSSMVTAIHENTGIQKRLVDYITQKHIQQYIKHFGNPIELYSEAKEYNNIKNSESYRVGKLVLALPRFIKKLLRGNT